MSFDKVEFTMPDRAGPPRADLLELMMSAMTAMAPGQALEALLARLETAK